MKSHRLPRTTSRLPRRGHVLVTMVVIDENGFTHHYSPVETPTGVIRDAAAAIHLHSPGVAPADGRSSGVR